MKKVNEPVAGVRHVLAPNPSPMTLDGTNTWIAGGWVVDPGPGNPAHLDAVAAAAGPGAQGIVLTHSHIDHSEGAEELAARLGGVEVVRPVGDGRAGPFEVVATPGHSADSVCLVWDGVLFSGDTVLGEGSVFVAPGDGSLSAYLASLERLLKLDLRAICPGHGPVVHDPQAKLREYLDHRRDREARVVRALEEGARTGDELLDRAWSEVDLGASPMLRVAAGATLAAHLEKLAEEGRLPQGVEEAALAGPGWGES